MKKRKRTASSTEELGKVHMINMAGTARLLIKVLSGCLIFVFGWLKLKGIDIVW
ncbi:MAG: hypothetical protein U0586_00665 [Candidatus Brocadiaceae bacterium]